MGCGVLDLDQSRARDSVWEPYVVALSGRPGVCCLRGGNDGKWVERHARRHGRSWRRAGGAKQQAEEDGEERWSEGSVSELITLVMIEAPPPSLYCTAMLPDS